MGVRTLRRSLRLFAILEFHRGDFSLGKRLLVLGISEQASFGDAILRSQVQAWGSLRVPFRSCFRFLLQPLFRCSAVGHYS